MKTCKIIITMMTTALLLIAGNAVAAISGACVDCHTMHNSQDGAAMNYDSSTAANAMLLKAGTCGGCHADANAAATGAIPQVNAATMAAAGAGGSFNWLTTVGDSAAHNVADLVGIDATLTSPPGYSNATTAGVNGDAATWAASTPLTCAGVTGCHGNPAVTGGGEFDSVKGAHHANLGNDGTTIVGGAGSAVGDSFRFLKDIEGIEMTGVGAPTASNHNVYAGSTDGVSDTTISALCARCHGNYHTRAEVGGSSSPNSSPWLRHPTDIDMKALDPTSEYAAYEYNLQAPVAATTAVMANLTNASVAADYDVAGGEIVTCLSCHFAHGSDQPDLLRWEYATMTAGAGVTDGCMNCHTTK